MAGIEGLWTVAFSVAADWEDGGVVIMDHGRLYGGDTRYYYLGTYEARGDVLKGTTRIVHYNGPRSNGFGESPDFIVTITGHCVGNVINGHIFKPQNPGNKLQIRCLRRESLA